MVSHVILFFEIALSWIDKISTSSTATLISSAWKCALGVYTPEETLPNTKTHRFQQIYKVAASAKGVVKAMTCTVAQPIDTTAGPPVLIIAIRGSASKIDHVVNANTRSDYMSRDQSITGHAGFVHSAEAVVSEVESQILAHKAQMRPSRDCPCHVVLTGHSAGGAVASLLYLLLSSRDDSDMRLSCITFGAPPCVSSTVNLSAVKSGLWDPPVCLNIINEFDFVSRADPPYLLCVINLLRSMYGLPSLEPSSDNDTKAPTTSSDTDSVSIVNGDDDAIWPTPPGLYRHIGELVILATRLDEATGNVRMHALKASPTQLSQLLFCRLSVHRRACYNERISLLASQSSVSEQR